MQHQVDADSALEFFLKQQSGISNILKINIIKYITLHRTIRNREIDK